MFCFVTTVIACRLVARPPTRVRAQRSTTGQQPIVLDLQRATHAVGLGLEERLSEVGVSQGEAHVLALLADGAAHTVGDLQRGVRHRPSTLSGILDRLEGRGLISRRLNEADRRSLLVRLSRPGRSVADAVVAAMRSIEETAASRVTSRDLAGFRFVVRALVEE
jgi:MarR family transcriptional regulator, organic hydroperoxide resistance regulator